MRRDVEEALVRLCTKIAMPMAPRVPSPRLNVPGAGMSVGRMSDMTGRIGRSPPAIGAKGVTPATVFNPNRNPIQAMTAFTSMKVPR